MEDKKIEVQVNLETNEIFIVGIENKIKIIKEEHTISGIKNFFEELIIKSFFEEELYILTLTEDAKQYLDELNNELKTLIEGFIKKYEESMKKLVEDVEKGR